MNNTEFIIHEDPFIKNFIYWYKYIDDILTCFVGKDRDLDTVLNCTVRH